ncbi:MAG TPA: FAD-binding oxidoreductase [Capillimicrobium sp.]|nr:FAD-binding oxidoreductase [Capillimicrobium sp.]
MTDRRRHVAIVGAGVMGLSCAVELAAHDGIDVTVIDKGYPGGGSTSRSVGVYTAQYLERMDIELRRRSIERLTRLERDAGLNLRRIGYVRVGRDAEATRRFHRSVEIQRELGPTEARVIDGDELRRLVPHFDGDGVESGLYDPSEGYVDGAELCTILAEHAQGLGVTVRVKTALQGAREMPDGRVSLATDRGEIAADVVVNCAGAWGARAGELLGAPIAVVNERHEAYTFELPPEVDYTVPMVMDYVPASDGEGLYFRQEGERQLVVGMHSGDILGAEQVEDPDAYYEGATQAGIDAIVERAAEAFPRLDELAFRGGWAGLYPHSAEGRPVVGPHPDDPRVIVAAGLGGTGLNLGPGMAVLVADWVVHGEPRSIEGAAELVPARR